MTLSVIFYPYHFVRAILSIPFCPMQFCPYTILSLPFCPYHFVGLLEFIFGTCRTVSKSNINVFDSIHSQAVVPLDQYTMFCGSCAEFFIQPFRSCVDDVDCFLIKPETLAFTDENIVMPYEFRHISHPIDCFLMEPYVVYPAFVRLRFLGQMRYNRESRTFEFIQKIETNILATTEIIEIIANENDESWCRVGPARKLSEMIALSDE